MTLARARRPVPVVPMVALLAVIGLLLSMVVAAPGSAATIPSGSTTQRGVNVYVSENGESAAAWKTDATNEMKGIKSLDANSVAIAFPFYTPSLDANCVYAYTSNRCGGGPTSSSPAPARVAVLVHAAQLAGLHVLLRPVMDETDLSPAWRGEIEPTSQGAWFTSYRLCRGAHTLELIQTEKSDFCDS